MRSFISPFFLFLSFTAGVNAQQNRNYDQFNYVATVEDDLHYDFGPEDWGEVQCPDLETCLGYPDTFEYGKGWSIKQGGGCLWCPDGQNLCETHHESPIELFRARAITTNEEYNECIDVHWMQYHDSACTFDQLREQQAFRIDRHALRIIQPIVLNSTGSYVLNCASKGKSWGRIDFSRGFSAWWYLSHIDLHLPSEHVQDGKRYDGELQMYHFYSKSGEDAGVDNQIGTVLVFLQSYDDTPDYAVLNRLICAWREQEEATLSQCGLNSVSTEYPGCVRYNRGLDTDDGIVTAAQEVNRQLHPRSAQAALDLFIENDFQMGVNASYQPKKILLDPNHHWVDPDSFDWDSFIADQYAKDARQVHGRELLNYNHVDWFNYFPMLGCRTEYYFRYSGTQTKPPCHGQFAQGQSRNNTNNWRVMKDPIRISKRQLAELHRLLRERVAPLDDPIRPCQPDTAGKVNEATGEINVARPLQQAGRQHYTVFCECVNWVSKWKEDQDWCTQSDQLVRFYDRPYNFATYGF